jgi:hypothetical protein
MKMLGKILNKTGSTPALTEVIDANQKSLVSGLFKQVISAAA